MWAVFSYGQCGNDNDDSSVSVVIYYNHNHDLCKKIRKKKYYKRKEKVNKSNSTVSHKHYDERFCLAMVRRLMDGKQSSVVIRFVDGQYSVVGRGLIKGNQWSAH